MTRRNRADCALVFPPMWYFAAVPADLSHTSAVLAARGIRTRCWDLSAALNHRLVGHAPGFAALRDRSTYAELVSMHRAWASLDQHCRQVEDRYSVQYRLRQLRFPDADLAHLPTSLRLGLDRRRNPALPLLEEAAEEVVLARPRVVGITAVHPDQLVFAPVFARALRRAGYLGKVVLYGSLEDVLAPEDFAVDLLGEPPHLLFEDVDGVVVGEAESALIALCEGRHDVPNLLSRDSREVLPARHIEDLADHPIPDLGWVRSEHALFPEPLVDIRLGRGCTWGRCQFCAIHTHQRGYRAGAVERVAATMADAHERLGSCFFRIRDDLVNARQLGQLAEAIDGLSFRPRWTVRSRFHAPLRREVLDQAAAAGLEEIWMGLESGVPRVRELMDKGVRQEVVLRILDDAEAVGVRIRALCIVGFPGETPPETPATFGFLEEHNGQLAGFSLTPFELMRNSRMADHPERFGLVPIDDPLPRHERLRYTVPARYEGAMPPDRIQALYQEALRRFEWVVRHIAGPLPSHAWIHASVAKRGWPSGR